MPKEMDLDFGYVQLIILQNSNRFSGKAQYSIFRNVAERNQTREIVLPGKHLWLYFPEQPNQSMKRSKTQLDTLWIRAQKKMKVTSDEMLINERHQLDIMGEYYWKKLKIKLLAVWKHYTKSDKFSVLVKTD